MFDLPNATHARVSLVLKKASPFIHRGAVMQLVLIEDSYFVFNVKTHTSSVNHFCRDTSVLCESLTYSQGPPEILEGTPSTSRPWTVTYSPPFDEFEVLRIRIPGTTRPLGLQEAIPASPVSQPLKPVLHRLHCDVLS